MPTPSLLWFDYETTGIDPVRDRPAQFAALRTDMELRPTGEPVMLYCAPAPDVLPHPEACLITGIAPQDAARDGLVEAEFAGAVHEVLAEPGTCSAGYNSIRFDDEVNRNLFYRNFFDPYEHAWKHGNARWDIMDLARACYALRPLGIEWPQGDDGAPSFKLDRLAPANHLKQDHAHDALSDVEATIELARLLRARQPRLYDWHFALRDKKHVAASLAQALPGLEPLLHVSGRYPPARGCLAMVAPIAEHPERTGSFIVADLGVDAEAWISLDPDDLAERMFTRRADLPEGIERPPLKEVHGNKSPFLAPTSALRGADLQRIALDPAACEHNLEKIRASDGLRERVRAAFAAHSGRWPERTDPECRLYAGFPSPADKRRCDAVRATPPDKLDTTDFKFGDPRYAELLFRYRARNWPDTLDANERTRWQAFVRDKLTRATETTPLILEQYFATIARLRAEHPAGPKQALLDRLQAWGETVQSEFGL
ncbi:MAG: exodeoxyribonuclease I [Rhodanobacteraceae bacterium]|nr:MAG: exodeoxyribonuclease I [Rhodanobacteraceae bacterium]